MPKGYCFQVGICLREVGKGALLPKSRKALLMKAGICLPTHGPVELC